MYNIFNIQYQKIMKFSKHVCLATIVLAMLLTGCSQKSITLEGKVTHASDAPIVYNITTDGIYLPKKFDTLHINPDSTYQISIPINGNEKLSLSLYGERFLGTIYLAPGKQKLDIDTSKSNGLNPVSKFTKENEILRKLADLNDNVFNLRTCQGDIFNVSKDTIASSTCQKLIEYATTAESELADADSEFKQRATQDIRMQVLLAFMNQYIVNYRKSSEIAKKEWNDSYSKMLEFTDISQAANVFSPIFADVISNMAGIEISQKKGEQVKDQNGRNQIMFDWYKANLQGRVQEVAMGLLLLEDANREYYATGVPTLYEEFKKLCPNSILLPKIEEAVQKNVTFNKAELPEGVNILNTDSVRTFKEITSQYMGKVIFIDVWATWCGPCRASFAHIKPLQEFAKENDIVLLYVSIDTPQKAELWKKMTGHYNLKGEHAIINKAFKMEIYDTFGKNSTLSIPHYAIVNKKGELQFPSAASPKDMEKLTEQLKEAAK